MAEQRWTDEQAHDAVALACRDGGASGDFSALGALKHCGVKLLTLEAERDALKLRAAALEAALCGYCICVCEGFAPRGGYDCAKFPCKAGVALSGDTTALRALLVEAAVAGVTVGTLNPASYTQEADLIADRILGANKGGGA